MVRPYELDDRERLVEFYSSLSAEVLKWSLPPYGKQRIESWLSNPGQHVILLAQHEGKIIGHLQIFGNPSPRMVGIGELIVYLHQDFLGVGLGTAMMRRCLEFARAQKFRRIGLTVIAENKNAIRVYEKVGFKREGNRSEAYRGEDGRYYDAVEMGIVFS
ncbi:MAG: GNAT family N-acetyltransferase [Thaumarchaeota archaeon]|nr:GNAT family N-acetyltransferase [Nitrososphaerota archaeon]